MHKPNPAAPGDTEASALHVGLLTGGGDRHYAFGLGTGLAASNVRVDFVGGDESDSPELYTTPGLTFLNLRRGGGQGSAWRKSLRLLQYYARLIGYAASARPRVFHILWNNRFESFDRTLLMLYYKALGKKITLTAHNVNAGTRDRTDSLLNRLTLRVQYRLADHIFVHTDKMKSELLESFGLPSRAVSVIRYGVNNAIPATGLTPAQARAQLGIGPGEKTILFFGNIAPYKGLHFLIEAFAQLAASRGNYRLIVAGRMKKGCDDYLRSVLRLLDTPALKERTTLRLEFIPDEETEKYFQAADVAVLPYVHIFQSGVMFLAYSFGVPVIVSDVGCLRDDVIEGTTGFVCPPEDATRLAATLHRYFDSDIYKNLTVSRQKIRDYAGRTHSWEAACQTTSGVYAELLGVSESVPVPPSCPDHEVRLRPFDANGAFRRTAGHDAGALRRLATRGAGITLLSGGASLAIQTIGTVVLARLLAPEDFGLVTMATTFSLLLVSFGENGLPEAVVQREEIDHALASNLFWINAAAGLLLTMAFAAAGAALALLWRNPLVRNVAAGISVTIVLTSVSILHLALLKRAMRFFEVSMNTMLARFVAVVVSILLAWSGWGYRALVGGAVAQALSQAVGSWILCNWVPGRPRQAAGTGSTLRFALHTYGRFGVSYCTRNADNLLVGLRFNAQSLGFYKKAYDLFALSATQFVHSLTLVAVSALSRMDPTSPQFRRYLLRTLTFVALGGMGLAAELTLIGKDLIAILLGPKWGESGKIFTLFGPGVGAMILYYTHGWIHLSIGRADRWLRWGLIEFATTLALFLIGLPFGPAGIALAWSVSYWLLAIPAIWYAGAPIGFDVRPVLKEIWRYILAAAAAGAGTRLVCERIPGLLARPGAGGAWLRILVTSGVLAVLYALALAGLPVSIAPLRSAWQLLRDMSPWRRRAAAAAVPEESLLSPAGGQRR